MSEEVSNPENMDMDQIRVLATTEMHANLEEGGSTQAEPVVPTQAEPAEAEGDVVYRYEIDLGEGSGKQVFEGETPEALIEKLGEAQRNATIKIRELSAAKKVEQKPVEMADAAKWVLAQELATDPAKAFDKLLQQQTGMTAAELKALRDTVNQTAATTREQTRNQQEYDATVVFRKDHPEYVANEINGKKMVQWLKLNGLPGTVENITKAFEELSGDGLLQLGESNTQGGATNGSRIVKVGGYTHKAASGLSTKRSGGTSKATSEPTEEEAYKLPMEELEKLANASMARS